MSTQYDYQRVAELISRTPRAKRPPIYDLIRRKTTADLRPAYARLPKEVMHTVRRLLADIAAAVAELGRGARPSAPASNVIRFPIERRLGRAA